MEEFKDVFEESTLKPMTGKPMHIHMKPVPPGEKPRQSLTARAIPHAYREQAKQELDKMVNEGIIRPVSEPTEWLSPFLVVGKPNGNVRLVVDFKDINRYILRPVHPFPSTADVLSSVDPTSKWFATLDATKGYWQVPLDEKSQLLTTFLTPWGRYCWCRAPMGLASSGDEYCERGDRALTGISNTIKEVDDILTGEATFPGVVMKLRLIFERCRSHGITLNPKKFFIGKRVNFVGHTISADGVGADPEKLKAIQEFPVPTNLTDLRSFIGLTNQLAAFHPHLLQLMSPLRGLLSSKVQWQWLDQHQKAFEATRAALVTAPVLAHFRTDLPTALWTDASLLNGFGFALMQNHSKEDKEDWRLITCGSRFLSGAESRYAAVEAELQAIVWAINKCHVYLAGLPHFLIISDHKPLKAICNRTNYEANKNPRIQRMLEKLTPYNFTVEWRAGKNHCVADALSRSPVLPPPEDVEDKTTVCQVHTKEGVGGLEFLANVAAEDEQYQVVIEALKKHLRSTVLPPSHPGRAYRGLWPFMRVQNGLIVVHGSRVLVPQAARKRIIQQLHISHQGRDRTIARAKRLYFWNGMANEISQTIATCNKCCIYKPGQQRETLQTHPLPKRPFQEVSMDLFEFGGRVFMVTCDRYSGWPVLDYYGKNTPNAGNIIDSLMGTFTTFGFPEVITSDGGRQYTSREFEDFCKKYAIEHKVSSAHHPSGNGHAERAVQAMKELVKKHWENNTINLRTLAVAILEWRNMQREDGLSPAQWLTGHVQKTTLPALSNAYKRVTEDERCVAEEGRKKEAEKRKQDFDRRSRDLPKMKIGDKVRIQDHQTHLWDRQGVVQGVRDGHAHRSYEVLSRGRILLRNRRMLRPFKEDILQEDCMEPEATNVSEPRRSTRTRRKPDRLQYSN